MAPQIRIMKQQGHPHTTRRIIALLALATSGLFCSFGTLSLHLPLFLPVDVLSHQRGLLSSSLRSSDHNLTSTTQRQEHYFLDLTKNRRIRKIFEGNPLFGGYKNDCASKSKTAMTDSSKLRPLVPEHCQKWAVIAVHSIDISATAVLQQIEEAMPSDDWCTAVVLPESERKHHDKLKHPKNGRSRLNMVSLLQLQQQGGVTKEFIDTLLLGSPPDGTSAMHSIFKNAGYLYALRHGAEYILDLEYGAEMAVLWKNLDETYFQASNMEEPILVDVPLMGDVQVLNSHPYIFPEDPILGSSWPRGYPKHHERSTSTRAKNNNIALSKTIDKSRIGIVHQISQLVPDLDTQGGLMVRGATAKKNIKGGDAVPIEKKNPLLVPRHAVAPYNVKATLHTSATLWAALLPTTLPSRISDIWRSYMAQTLFASMNLHTVLVPPPPEQKQQQLQLQPYGQPRTPMATRNISRDDGFFDQTTTASTEHLEMDTVFYTQVPDLLHALEQYAITSENATSLPQKLEDLWIHLYEQGFVEYKDVLLLQHWLRALVDCSPYDLGSHDRRLFPYYRNVVLMGQFNFANYPKHIAAKDLSSEALLQLLDYGKSNDATPD